MPNYNDETIADALDAIASRRYVLPAIQREFVWSPSRICSLFDSLMRDYPISSLLYWRVDKEHGDGYRWYDFVLDYHELERPGCPPHASLPPEDRIAVLDGQQRLTALNIGLRGSHAARTKWRRVNNPQSYPTKYLYLDIAAEPGLGTDKYEDQFFRFDFLEPARAQEENEDESGPLWFQVSTILAWGSDSNAPPHINAFLADAGLAGHPSAFDTLWKLWRTVHEQRHLSYFTESTESLDRVLDIFIRVNSQGQPLSKSDLLMSVATAQWEKKDAREEIPATLRRVNAVAPGFAFERDHILKAGLVLAGISDVGFRAEVFNRGNMQQLEDAWDEISARLHLAAELFASFGLSRDNIDAKMVLIPVAYYLHRRALDERYLASPTTAGDRSRIRDWTVRALLMPGVFGSGLDTVLGRLRRTIDDHGAAGFPSDAIEDAMASMGKSLRFDRELVEELSDSSYGRPDTYSLLSILYSHVDPAGAFHVDHIFPRSILRRDHLRDAGYDEAQVERIVRVARDGLGNLQLLPGGENIGKSDRMPLAWARSTFADRDRLRGYLEQNDMLDVPEDASGFLDFYDARRERIRDRLLAVLGREPGSLAQAEPDTL